MTAIFAWIIFGERMRPMEIVGGLLLLAAVWIVGRREKMEIPQMEEMIPPVAQV
jgi:drug/metabolite transporter (DMT)-like permease